MLEAVLAVGMLGLLFVVLMSVYLSCARALAQGEARTSLAGELQVATSSLVGDLERSAYAGLSVEPGAVSLLSPQDEQGRVEFDPSSGSLRWSRYRIYYLKGHELCRRDNVLKAGAPERVQAQPLRPLTPWRDNGTVIARDIYGFSVTQAGDRMVRVEVSAQRERYGRQEPERLSRSLWARVHN